LKAAITNFICNFDINGLNDILDENLQYQKLEKHIFLDKLGIVFAEFLEVGDTYLESHSGHCNRCNKCDSGISFIGNKSRSYIDLIIVSENGKVSNIFECSDFATNEKMIIKGEKRYINDHPF
jgi:hypothetical protein